MKARIIVVMAAALLTISTAAFAMFNQALNLSIKATPSAPINGVCGSANGVTTSSAPISNLCSAGNASSVTGSGPWSWTCNGSNGGTNASCSAPLTGSGGGVPQPALDAGFTTIALNSDFTDSNHANLSQWLDCAGATNPEWYIGWIGFSTGPGCGAWSMAADSATGTPQALRMQWINAYLGSNPNATTMETVNLSVTQGMMVTNFYLEMVARLGVVETNINPDWWNTGSFNPTALDDGGSVEWDGFEAGGPDQYGTGIHNWDGPDNGCNGHWCVAVPTGVLLDTNYHRFAWRTTGLLGTGYTLNSYYEDVPFSSGLNKIATVNMGPGSTNGTNNANPHLSGGKISSAPIITIGSAGRTLPEDAVLWVKSIKIYVCPAWTANQTGPGKTIGGPQQCFTSSQDP